MSVIVFSTFKIAVSAHVNNDLINIKLHTKIGLQKFLVMKVLDIRSESHVFLTLRSRVAVGSGTRDPLFFIGPRV